MRKLRLSDIKQFVPDPKVNATVSFSGITNSPKLKWLKTTVIFFPLIGGLAGLVHCWFHLG